jgi:cell division protein FtsI/penicillin-binding protein 2
VTGLGLTAETPGVVRQTRNMVDFSRCAYGYSVSVTPVQLATAYASIANGGMLPRPRIVRRVTDCEGKVVWENPVECRRRVASAKACNQVTVGLREVIDVKGTGKQANVPGFSVAGKTGTAHLWNPQKKEYDKERPVCSFAGFLPAECPKLVCVVVCSEPEAKIERYGGTIAAPIFARIATRAMDQMGVAPDMPLPQTAGIHSDH